MYDATGEEEFEDKPFVLILETHAYPEFWSDEYADNIKDMVGDDTINPRTIDYLSDAHSYGLGVPLSTDADGMRFETEEEAIKFLNSKKLNDQISGLGFLSGFHFDKQINRIGDTGWKYLSKQVGADYEEYAKGGEAGGGRIDKMDKFISELAKKNTKEFSVNEYHDFRNKKYAIGVARHYFTDNDGSFSKFDTKLGDALNIDFETQGDSTFITLGIDDLPQKYGVSEKWLDGKLKLINKPINNKTRNKLLSQLQERFMDDWENNLIGFAPNKKSIVWLEYDYDAQTGLEELSKDGDYVAKKGSKYEEFDNDIWDEYFSSIADDEDEE